MLGISVTPTIKRPVKKCLRMIARARELMQPARARRPASVAQSLADLQVQEVHMPDQASLGLLTYRCNACGKMCRTKVTDLGREKSSCQN